MGRPAARTRSDLGADALAAAFAAAPTGMVVLDRDGRFLALNRAAEQLLGRPAAEVLREGGGWESAIDRQDVRRLRTAITGALEGRGPIDVELRLARRDGETVWVRLFATPLEADRGRGAERWVASVVDITRRRAETVQLAETTTRLRAVAQVTPDALVMKDGDARVIFWNPAAEAMFGYSAQEALGRPYEELTLPPAEHETFRRLHGEVIAGRPLTVTILGQRADGSTFPSQVSAAPLPQPDGPPHTVAIIRDVSLLVDTRNELAERARQLERSNADLQAFAYHASHDLQEPLKSIVMAADALIQAAGDRLEPSERALLVSMDETASRMSEQITTLMELARVEVGPAPPEPQPVEPALQDAMAALSAAIEQTDARVEVVPPLPQTPFARRELALVLQNLLGNALKFRRPDEPPRITLRAHRSGALDVLCVADNGIGLEPRDAERIFGLFQRARPDVAGAGLGLALVRRIVQRRGGSVDVRSEGLGRGTEFLLCWPALGG